MPSKSLPAQAIEASVLGRIRQAQGGDADARAWEQMDRERQREVIEGLVERIGYNGATRQISIRFRAPEVVAAQEARA